MDIYVYSDESGVLDKKSEKFYVFGGLIFLNKDIRDIENRKYLNVERTIRKYSPKYKGIELKACKLKNKDKGKIFRSLNSCIKFGIVIRQERLLDSIYSHKKTKQRYLDYAYKIGLKRAFEKQIEAKLIDPKEVKNLNVYVDEHTTATDGYYELKEGLEAEFKYGTHNFSYAKFFPPIFPRLESVNVLYKDSSKTPLIRAADITANRIYYKAKTGNLPSLSDKVILTYLP
ncbi:DUF3800 domain-containing protein [Facklamia hominis]